MSEQDNHQRLSDSAPSLPGVSAYTIPDNENEQASFRYIPTSSDTSYVNGYHYGESDTASQASTRAHVNGHRYAESDTASQASTPSPMNGHNYNQPNTTSPQTPMEHPLEHPRANVYVHEVPDIGSFEAQQGQRLYGHPGPDAQVPPGTPPMNGYRYERLHAGAPYIPQNAPGVNGNGNGHGQGLPTIAEVPSEDPAARMHRVLIEFQPPPIQVPVVLPELRASYSGVRYSGALGSSIPLTARSQPLGHPRMSDSPRTQEQPRSPETPPASEHLQTHGISQTPTSATQYIPICPSPDTAPAPVNSTDPLSPSPAASPASPPPTLDNLSEAFWHEYDTILTPEAIAYQASLLSAWNSEASTTRIRTAEERAHIRAVELESELLSERERRERRERQREARRDRHRQERRQRRREEDDESGSANRGPPSLLSGLFLRLRERVLHNSPRPESRSHSQNQNQSTLSRLTNLHLPSRSSISLSLSANADADANASTRSHPRPRPHTRSRSRTRQPPPSPPPPPPSRTSSPSPELTPQPQPHPHPPSSSSSSSSSSSASSTPSLSPPPEQQPTSQPTPAPNLCTLCNTNPGTLIQGPLSESLSLTSSGEIPFVCCQGCLDEVLEAEVEVARRVERNGGGRERESKDGQGEKDG